MNPFSQLVVVSFLSIVCIIAATSVFGFPGMILSIGVSGFTLVYFVSKAERFNNELREKQEESKGRRFESMKHNHTANIERALRTLLAPAYEDFARLTKEKFPSSDDRLRPVRQFCEFLLTGKEPERYDDPPPPRI